ncbi:MAG TPA: STAS domain-containing protein [Burkholderiaceae bacterium]|nr:STAS domain-containing protein [Burkholderiaceae bacterium]
MAKDLSPTGLFSKVVKFVRHPATSWTDLDTVAEQQDPDYSKQALKEMIERKRRNDFVRKREFDMLRKLRNKSEVKDAGSRGRPSFFQSSYSSKPDDRAGTLKKIDEIEAQMSMQWWKTKQRGDTHGSPMTEPPPDAIDSVRAYRTTVMSQDSVPHAKQPGQAGGPVTEQGSTLQMTTRMSTISTEPSDLAPLEPTEADRVARTAERQRPMSGAPQRPRVTDAGPTKPFDFDESQDASTFSSSKFYALDVNELAMDPEIEEAAIRFASGDEVATEQGLLDVLTRKTNGGTPDEWMALFDLYRATGQVEAFEGRAIDFANRFSKSAPQWFSMPEEAAKRVEKSRVAEPAGKGRAAWVADADLDAHAITMLTKVLERTPQPWQLDWSELETIQPMAVARLNKLFSTWAQSDVELCFTGTKRLLNIVQALTVSGDRSVDKSCWDMHMALLRVMNLPDDFELTALDFCVTYEISPPGWEPPRCRFRETGAVNLGMAGLAEVSPADPDFVTSTRPASLEMRKSGGPVDLQATSSFSFHALQGELVGELQGDPAAQLAELDKLMGESVLRVVSCRYLVRVDFAAAGAILNWASAHQAAGRRVRFADVHRLIAAFFHVIGITEYADVDTRMD